MLEITSQSCNEMKIRVSPLHAFTRLVACQPELGEGEFLTLTTANKKVLSHWTDNLAQEESFFAYNVMDIQSGCVKCEKG
jgi:hypothetical protein